MTPEGWVAADLGEICDLRMGGTPARKEADYWDPEKRTQNRWVAISDIRRRFLDDTAEYISDLGVANSRGKRIDAGTPLMSFKLTIGRATIPTVPVYTNEAIVALVPRVPAILGYLYYAVPRIASSAVAADAVKGKTLNKEMLQQLRLLVPPLPEQLKIAAILSAVDEVIEKTEAVIESLQTLKKAMMEKLLTQGLPGRHTRFKQSELGKIPEKWETVQCGEVFDVQLGKMVSPNARGGAAQFPYLRNQNVYWDRFDLTDIATMHFDERERQKFRLKPGDLLACEGRHIGRCAIWNGAIDECYYQKALHRLRAKSDRVTTHYMQHFMTLRFRYRDDLVSHVRTSTTIPHLPLEQLLALTVVVPPRAEQDQITERLAMLRAREHAEEANMDALRAAKDALIAALLTGELRVTPDEDAA